MNKLLGFTERVLIVLIIIDLLLNYFGSNIPFLLTIALGGLAFVYFINVYRVPVQQAQEHNENNGFSHLLGTVIVPRIAWISGAIILTGLCLYSIGSEVSGYRKLLTIGGSTMAVAMLILLINRFRGIRTANNLDLIFRGTTLLLVCYYILFY